MALTYSPLTAKPRPHLMFLQRLLKSDPVKGAGERLYAATVARARAPSIYADLGALDTPDGRFEIYTLHVLLVLERLRAEAGADAARVAQAYFDAYLSGLDHGLRELAVGDLTVGKTMRKLGEAFYGRGKALDATFASLPDRGPLIALLGRTALAGAPGADAGPLADYVVTLREALARTPAASLLAGEFDLAAAS
jgi:cytochrome b pre-mRNA-processing protein 3